MRLERGSFWKLKILIKSKNLIKNQILNPFLICSVCAKCAMKMCDKNKWGRIDRRRMKWCNWNMKLDTASSSSQNKIHHPSPILKNKSSLKYNLLPKSYRQFCFSICPFFCQSILLLSNSTTHHLRKRSLNSLKIYISCPVFRSNPQICPNFHISNQSKIIQNHLKFPQFLQTSHKHFLLFIYFSSLSQSKISQRQ